LRIAVTLQQLPAAEPTKKWLRSSVAEGDAGMALMCGYVGACTGDPAWRARAHQYLQGAAMFAAREGPGPSGLFDGLAGLGFVASSLAGEGGSYQRLLASIDDALHEYLSQPPGDGRRSRPDFDVESGLAGVGTYLLERAGEPGGLANATRVAEILIGDALDRATPPPWAKVGDAVHGFLRTEFPHGFVDCGLAHGVAGPMAFLARARTLGVRAEGLDEALQHLVTWLAERRRDDEYGPRWPVGVALDVAGRVANGFDDTDRPPPDAWCYGTPGVARALWLAGTALNDAATCEQAADAMLAVHRRLAGCEHVIAPGLCHGLAGLLQITMRFHQDTGDERFADHAQVLIDRLLVRYEPDSAYGYREHDHPRDPDNPGFVDGAAGVAMALLAASSDVTPEWDRMLLVA
jgi:lantibiotic modifying enzyme